jgi:hypothetical protein
MPKSDNSNNLPDIDGFLIQNFPHAGPWSQLVEGRQLTTKTLSNHSVEQMLSAQLTGEEVGFLVYDKALVQPVGGKNHSYERDYDPYETVRMDRDGRDYLIVKVTLPKQLHKLVIESVSILSRSHNGSAEGSKWSAVGTHSYTMNNGYSGTSRHKIYYDIYHENGVTTIEYRADDA